MTEKNPSESANLNEEKQSWGIRISPLAPAPPPGSDTAQSSSVKSPASQPSPSTQPPTKRQKVSIACQECRTHKTKCDGVRPICGSCRKKKPTEIACSYNPERGKRGIKNQYVQLLEDKVKELEAAMEKSKSNEPEPEPIEPSQQQVQPEQIEDHANSSSPVALQRSHLLHTDHLPIPHSPTEAGTSALHPHATPITQLQNRRYTEGNISDRRPEVWINHPTNNATSTASQQREDSVDGNTVSSQQNLSAIDAMGAITRDQDNKSSRIGDNNQGYFGSSSAGRFMKQVHDVIDKKSASYSYNNCGSLFSSISSQGSPTSVTSHKETGRTRGSVSGNFSTDLLSNVVLPPRRIADNLVNAYWVYVHTLYPFLHKPSFMQTYSQLWGYSDHATPQSNSSAQYNGIEEESGLYYESENEPLFQCILNLVFALGCQLSPENTQESEREAASDVFFQRSKKLLHFDILETSSMKTVQALLLMGQYLQCTKLPGRCWIVVGLAIRAAQGLGLHLEGKGSYHTQKNAVSQLESQLRKRLWGGCIVLDRFLSMAYGRPFMIPIARDLKLPEIVDDELLTASPHLPAVQPEEKPIHMAFFVHTVQLYEIMGDILHTLYSDNSEGFSNNICNADKESSGSYTKSEVDEHNLAKTLNSIIRLEITLNSWKESLPIFLQHKVQCDSSINDSSAQIFLRQTNVLKARYLHVCILLYRPLLVFYFTLEESSHCCKSTTDLQKALFVQSSKTCVTIAQDLIKTIKTEVKAQLPAWWYSIFYLYTAATVLLMARLFPKIRVLIGAESLLTSWNDCLECIEEYQSYGESAKKCYQYLSELDKHVWAATSQEQSAPVMSSIQILGTLPQHGNLNIPSNNISESEQRENATAMQLNNNSTEWDFDLQDISWLGRLPIYTDLESGYNMSANTWGNFGFL